MCMCVDVKNRIVTCENLYFGEKKGYKLILKLGSPKTYCYHVWQFFNNASGSK